MAVRFQVRGGGGLPHPGRQAVDLGGNHWFSPGQITPEWRAARRPASCGLCAGGPQLRRDAVRWLSCMCGGSRERGESYGGGVVRERQRETESEDRVRGFMWQWGACLPVLFAGYARVPRRRIDCHSARGLKLLCAVVKDQDCFDCFVLGVNAKVQLQRHR